MSKDLYVFFRLNVQECKIIEDDIRSLRNGGVIFYFPHNISLSPRMVY